MARLPSTLPGVEFPELEEPVKREIQEATLEVRFSHCTRTAHALRTQHLARTS